MRLSTALILILVFFTSCSRSKPNSFENEFRKWQDIRIERLKSKTGWLNLAGLYWLKEGENSIGSDSSNSIVFPPQAPAFIGTYLLQADSILFIADQGTEINRGGEPVSSLPILTDRSGVPTLLEHGRYAWFIIDRSGKFGIRLRDYENPAIDEFHGIEIFPPSDDWVIEAEFERFEEPMLLQIPTVLGTVETDTCPGVLHFSIGGEEQELYTTKSGEGLFLIFADETSGLETYGGGRFLHIRKIGSDGQVRIDFNHAYNPPCAFTPFATCPLPPRQNYLDVRIEAGEKFAGHQ